MSAILTANNVTKNFGGVRALDDVSFEMPDDGVMGLIGPNGAGKTTLFNVVSGHLVPDEGEILYGGQPTLGLRPSRLARMGIGRSWQDVRVFDGMSVLDNVLVGLRTETAEYPIKRLFRWREAAREERDARIKALDVLGQLGIGSDLAAVRVEDLAFAEQKIVAFARLLVAEPELLLLDEPASGLDARSVERILEVVRRIATLGVPVLIVEHNLSVVRAVANLAVFMSNGRVIAVDDPDALVQRQDLVELYFGSRWSSS